MVLVSAVLQSESVRGFMCMYIHWNSNSLENEIHWNFIGNDPDTG